MLSSIFNVFIEILLVLLYTFLISYLSYPFISIYLLTYRFTVLGSS